MSGKMSENNLQILNTEMPLRRGEKSGKVGRMFLDFTLGAIKGYLLPTGSEDGSIMCWGYSCCNTSVLLKCEHFYITFA